MKERPIPFNGQMVRAILEGRKTQTRRVLKPQPPVVCTIPKGHEFSVAGHDYLCPYGNHGDRLYVRETLMCRDDGYAIYAADGKQVLIGGPGVNDGVKWEWKKDIVPSIHMPRWASRITLEITSVRVERLQDISEEDARAEGVDKTTWALLGKTEAEVRDISGLPGYPDERQSYRNGFATLWRSINGPGSWDVNPWLWVIEFERI